MSRGFTSFHTEIQSYWEYFDRKPKLTLHFSLIQNILTSNVKNILRGQHYLRHSLEGQPAFENIMRQCPKLSVD